MSYNKRFPTDFRLGKKPNNEDHLTFLNDKNVSAELYAIMLSKSFVLDTNGTKKTYCPAKEINQTDLAKNYFHCDRRTINNKIKYLEARGFIEIVKKPGATKTTGYYLYCTEKAWQDIPIETLNYLIDNFKEHIIKIYLYLAAAHEWCHKDPARGNFNFTKQDLFKHCSIPDRNGAEYTIVDNALDALNKIELISTRYIKIANENLDLYKIELLKVNKNIKANPAPAPHKVVETVEEIKDVAAEMPTFAKPKPKEIVIAPPKATPMFKRKLS